MTNLHKSDEQLWKNLISGEESAFSALFERHHSALVRYGHSLLPHRETVQDCVQDVFVDVWMYRRSLNPSVSAKAYLISSVRKRIARKHKRDKIFRKAAQLDNSMEKIIEFSLDFTVEDRLIADE